MHGSASTAARSSIAPSPTIGGRAWRPAMRSLSSRRSQWRLADDPLAIPDASVGFCRPTLLQLLRPSRLTLTVTVQDYSQPTAQRQNGINSLLNFPITPTIFASRTLPALIVLCSA